MKDILRQGEVKDNVYFLPDVQMDRKEYLKCADHLKFLGGKWNRGKKGFVFDRTITIEEISGYEEKKIKKTQFFPTPEKIADKMVQYLRLEDYHSILEPSAGRGALIKAVHKVVPDVQVRAIELDETNCKYLESYSGNISLDCGSFFDYDIYDIDRIIANPPFTKNQDIEHIKEMYECLKDGGEMVSLSSTSWQKGSQKKQVEFQKWIEKLEEDGRCEIETIPAGEFKESGTMIETLLIWIKK